MASSAVWRTSPPVFCLTVDWSPAPIRVATRRIAVTTRDGKVKQYAGGLEEPEVEETVSLGGQSSGPRDVTVRMLLSVDLSEKLAKGASWWNVTGELALYSEAEAWEERVVLLSGRVTPVSGGRRGSLLELQLSEPAWEDPALFPPPEAAVSKKTWPDAPESSLGSRYPWVFGVSAGALRDDDGTAYSVPATPAVCVDESGNRLLVAGHRVLASTVIVRNETRGASTTLAVSTVRDELGAYVSVCDYTGEASGHSDPEDDWLADDTYSVRDWTGGALQAEDGEGPLRGLGDLMLFLARRSGVTMDLPAWRAVRDVGNRLEIGGYLDDASAPLGTIKDVFLPLLPDLTLASGPQGIRPIWFRPLAGGHAVPITVGATFARVNPDPTTSDTTPVTDADVSYGYDVERGEYRGRSGVTGDPWSGDLGPTTHSRTGRARHGRPERVSLESRWLWSARCAQDVARTTVRMAWTPPDQDALSAPIWAYPLFPLGTVVSVTDEDAGRFSQRWWVTGRTLREGWVELNLERVEDPVSAPRRAS